MKTILIETKRQPKNSKIYSKEKTKLEKVNISV